MLTSIRKIIDEFKDFADNHPMIQSFYCNIILPQPEDRKYPMMNVEIGDSYLYKGAIITDFNIYYLDILNESKDNDVDIFSNSAIFFENFYTKYFEINYDSFKFCIPEERNELRIKPIKLENFDNAIGHTTTIGIKTLMTLLKENIPVV